MTPLDAVALALAVIIVCLASLLVGAAREATLMRDQRDYYRVRLERLTDAALARAGAIHEPTMEQPTRPPVEDAAAKLMAAYNITETDSRRTKESRVPATSR